MDSCVLNTLLLIELKYPNNPYSLRNHIYNKLSESKTLLEIEKEELKKFKPTEPTLVDLFKF